MNTTSTKERLFFPRKVTKINLNFDNGFFYFDADVQSVEICQTLKSMVIDFALEKGIKDIDTDNIRYCVEFAGLYDDKLTEVLYARYDNLLVRYDFGDVTEHRKQVSKFIRDVSAKSRQTAKTDDFFESSAESISEYCKVDGETVTDTEVFKYAVRNVIYKGDCENEVV